VGIRRLIEFVAASCLVFLLTTGVSSADPVSGSGGAGPAVASSPPGIAELYKALRDERKILERQAERHVDSMEFLYSLAMALFASLLAVGAGLVVFQFGKTKKEIRDEMKEHLKKEAEAAVEKEAAELRRRHQSLKNEVDDLIAYKSRKVLWVGLSAEKERIQRIVTVMKAFGITNIEHIQGEEPDLVNRKRPDLVILSFDGTDSTRSLLRWIVDETVSERPVIPLLIFTYGQNSEQHRLGPDEFEILKGCDWYLPANVPATLITQTKVLLSRGRENYINLS